MLRKIIILSLAIGMIFTSFPIASFAAEVGPKNASASVTNATYSEPLKNDYSVITSDKVKKIHEQFSSEMLMLSAYFYPELTTELNQDQLKLVLSWSDMEAKKQFDKLSQDQVQVLQSLAPVVVEHFNWKPERAMKNKTERSKTRQTNQITTNALNINSTMPADNSFTYKDEQNEYKYVSKTDQPIDMIYRSSTQRNVDLFLQGKHGLDLQLVRTYNSLQSKATQPIFDHTDDNERIWSKPSYNPYMQYPRSIAAGWTLSLPKVEDSDWMKLNFFLEDGSVYEFRYDQHSMKFYLHSHADESAKLTIINDNTTLYRPKYYIDLDNNIRYEFFNGRTTKTNKYGDKITFDNQGITDSLNRRIEILRSPDIYNPIVGLQVKDASGNVIRKMSYDVQKITSTQNLRSYADEGEDEIIGYFDYQGSYYQLNMVKDEIENKILNSYTYYERGPARHASFYPYFSEFDYLLLKEATDDTGFTMQYMYQPYDKNWYTYATADERTSRRGTVNNYVNEDHPSNIVSYHPVTKVFYKYTNASNELKILEQSIQGETSVDPQMKDYVKGDAHTTTIKTLYGDYTNTESTSFLSTGRTYNMLRKERTIETLDNGLNFNDDNKTYGITNHEYTTYQYDDLKRKPYLVKTFDGGNPSDPRPQTIKDFLMYGNSRTLPLNLNQYAALNKIEYDSAGRVIFEEDSYGNKTQYEYLGRYNQLSYKKQSSTDGLTQYEEYMSYGNTVPGELASVKKVSTYRNPENQAEVRTDTLLTEYLDFNLAIAQPTLVRETTSGFQFSNQGQTLTRKLEYDPNGLFVTKETTQVTLSDGQPASAITMLYQYDTRDRLKEQTYPDGSKANYQYDNKDRMTSVTFTPSPSTPGPERTTTYTYNDSMRQVTKTLPDGEKLLTTYTPYGEIEVQQKNKETHTRTILRTVTDSSGKLIKESIPYDNASMKTSYLYGGNGAVQTVTSPFGQQTQYAYANYTYDNISAYLQNTIRITEPDGREQWTYQDKTGRVTKQVEKSPTKTRTTLLAYNPFGKLSQKQVKAGDVTQTTNYGYDALGNLIYLKDELGQVYTYLYNYLGQPVAHYINGQLQKQTSYNEIGWPLTKSNTGGEKEQFVYQLNGLVAQYTDKAGQIHVNSYTPYNEVNRVSVRNSSGTEMYWKQNNYDQMTRLVTGITTNENELLSFSYDDWKRLKGETVAGRDYAFDYDNFDRLHTIVYPGGETTTYEYDELNRIKQVSYPDMGNVTLEYNISPNQNLYKVNYPNNQSIVRKSDAFKELVSVEHSNNTTPTWTTSYAYDGFGNIQSYNQNGIVSSFQYDGLNRIKQEQVPGNTNTYSYDSRGNRQTLESTQVPIATSKGSLSLSYNAINELMTYNNNSDTSASYTYYGDGLRATKTVNGNLTRFVYLNGRVLDELDANGNVKARNVWGNELLWRKDSTLNQAGYYYYNGHGDVVSIKDKSGSVLNTYDYDIWGNILSKTEGINNPYRYAGEPQDDESGFIYLRARYYDPSTGRFINEDTYEGDITNPLSLNLYTYVGNNPLTRFDPTGHDWAVDKALPLSDAERDIISQATIDYENAIDDDGRAEAHARAMAVRDKYISLQNLKDSIRGLQGEGILDNNLNFATDICSNISEVELIYAFAGTLIDSNQSKFLAAFSRDQSDSIAEGLEYFYGELVCFTEDTLIATKEGNKVISDIKVGDEVYSENVDTGEKGLKKVTQLFIKESKLIVRIQIESEEIKSTPTHPFWIKGKGWVKAENIVTGDRVQLYSGEEANVRSVIFEYLKQPVKVYNFEVEEWHTYFVSIKKVLVHNTCSQFNNTTTRGFWKAYDNLTPELQKAAVKQFQIFKRDPSNTSLKFEKMPQYGKDVWSARVNNAWRAMGKMKGNVIEWYDINKHYGD
ncbi:polymorphic toxin-type HINT domain-containing protein [Gorillibacterium sp. sgz5001074]|uniref:polymorphic toxin-type HINT domain-containing protein n=1 Tax=Gorillibacterium sp. sgz5001074 TaxID=3446695 RepID=UPI003F67A028